MPFPFFHTNFKAGAEFRRVKKEDTITYRVEGLLLFKGMLVRSGSRGLGIELFGEPVISSVEKPDPAETDPNKKFKPVTSLDFSLSGFAPLHFDNVTFRGLPFKVGPVVRYGLKIEKFSERTFEFLHGGVRTAWDHADFYSEFLVGLNEAFANLEAPKTLFKGGLRYIVRGQMPVFDEKPGKTRDVNFFVGGEINGGSPATSATIWITAKVPLDKIFGGLVGALKDLGK